MQGSRPSLLESLLVKTSVLALLVITEVVNIHEVLMGRGWSQWTAGVGILLTIGLGIYWIVTSLANDAEVKRLEALLGPEGDPRERRAKSPKPTRM